MSISEIIINDIQICSLSQNAGTLKQIFNELTYSHLPVESDGNFIGCVSESDVRCFDAQKKLSDYQYALVPFFVRPDDSLLDILRVFSINDTNLVPVLEAKSNRYLGYIELTDILGILQDTPFFGEEGNNIVVEKGENDYSFSEISQIVESNDGRIYGCYLNKLSNGIVQITLKISHANLNEILQSFRRYDYKIISQHEEDSYLQNLKERSEYLNKYLNI